ncbi:MAG TPA: VWA domain-containing protein [Pyrinomonadaceae bacterium]|nr:VWA domain-containing protein [Pyrinomonadaceae bacterium]
MRPPRRFSSRLLLLSISFCLLSHVPAMRGQEPAPAAKPAAQDDEVLRIKTELVQTDVTVVDRQGRFVEGLRPEQFELSLDGKPQAVSFFERVATGSSREAAQVAAGRTGRAASDTPTTNAGSNNEGRILFFFLDDLHLAEASLMRTRRALTDFVENQMSQNDRVAIVSASGQIGFLQQLTDYKPVLKAAIERLNYKKNPETYAGKVPISDYQATRIVDHGDRELFAYLLMATVNEYQAKGPLIRVAANIVKNRVRQIASQAKITTNDVLGGLESLMLSSSQLPGRKLVFFVSDGFITETRANSMDLLKRVTEMAARTGVVVYTMDARGTFNDPVVDAGSNRFPDGMASGTQAQNPTMENGAMQEPLHIIAEDTGGRAIINSNSFKDAFQQAINETADYYLLAWRPETDDARGGRARIKVIVKDRRDLRVRVRRNYYVPPKPAAEAAAKNEGEKRGAAASSSSAPTPEAELVTALGSIYPHRIIPTALSVGYVQESAQGPALKASMQIEREALEGLASEAKKSEVDVLGAAIDDRGVIVTFKQLLTVTPDPSAQNQRQPIVWNQQLSLPPGLYQVRVAVRERQTGRTGGAQAWIEVPDIASGGFQMSSLFLGERKAAAVDERYATAPRPVMVDVDRRFTRASVLRFQTYIYNAGRGASSSLPDVEIQTRVFRDNRAIVTLAPVKLPTDTTKDLTRLPYWAEIGLDQLPAGKYALQVTAIDRTTKVSVSQQTTFVVE